jgi:hypothetical protein
MRSQTKEMSELGWEMSAEFQGGERQLDRMLRIIKKRLPAEDQVEAKLEDHEGPQISDERKKELYANLKRHEGDISFPSGKIVIASVFDFGFDFPMESLFRDTFQHVVNLETHAQRYQVARFQHGLLVIRNYAAPTTIQQEGLSIHVRDDGSDASPFRLDHTFIVGDYDALRGDQEYKSRMAATSPKEWQVRDAYKEALTVDAQRSYTLSIQDNPYMHLTLS